MRKKKKNQRLIERGEDQEKEEINYADFLNNVGFFFFFFSRLFCLVTEKIRKKKTKVDPPPPFLVIEKWRGREEKTLKFVSCGMFMFLFLDFVKVSCLGLMGFFFFFWF